MPSTRSPAVRFADLHRLRAFDSVDRLEQFLDANALISLSTTLEMYVFIGFNFPNMKGLHYRLWSHYITFYASFTSPFMLKLDWGSTVDTVGSGFLGD